MSTLLNVRLSKNNYIYSFQNNYCNSYHDQEYFLLMFRSTIIQWFVKNYNSNIHYFTFTWTLVLPPMNKVSDILLVLKMITTLNNKDWWYLVVLKWKVKKKSINHSIPSYSFIFSISFHWFRNFTIHHSPQNSFSLGVQILKYRLYIPF